MAQPPAREGEPPPAEERAADAPTVENRWWVDSGTAVARRRSGPADAESRPRPIVGERLFRVGRDFDQDRARARLSESHLDLLREGNPPESGWAYLAMTNERSRDDFLARVKQLVRLPRGARAVIVDSGVSLRIIATGKTIGERFVEITLGGESSFDAWVNGEWVHERVFRSRERALREASGVLQRFLDPKD
jgi:hypothetical protein